MLGADKYVSIGNRTKINPFRHHGQNRNLRQALIQASKKLACLQGFWNGLWITGKLQNGESKGEFKLLK